MDVEHMAGKFSPFQKECDTRFFYSGAKRGDILQGIQKAIVENVALVTLTGEEGTGKTMLCKMMQEQWREVYSVVSVTSRAESFEDVARVVAKENNIDYPEDAKRADAKNIFLDIAKAERETGSRLLLICDQAECIYLATLERIRKILDDVNAQGGGLQVLLVGRTGLNENLAQLDMCNFEPISTKRFTLSPVPESEIWNYLNFCIQKYRGTSEQEVFTRKSTEKIALLSNGSLRMVNRYADIALQASLEANSSRVLLDHVKDTGAKRGQFVSGRSTLLPVSYSSKYIVFGGIFLTLLLLLFVFKSQDENTMLETRAEQETAIVLTIPSEQQDLVIEEVAEEPKNEEMPEPVLVDSAAKESVSEFVQEKESIHVEFTERPVSVAGESRSSIQQLPVVVVPKTNTIFETLAEQKTGVVLTVPPEQQESAVEEVAEAPKKEEVPEPVLAGSVAKESVPDPVQGKVDNSLEVREPPVPVADESTSSNQQIPVAIAPVKFIENSQFEKLTSAADTQSRILADNTKRIVTPILVAERKKKNITERKVLESETPSTYLSSRNSEESVLEKAITAGKKWMAGESDDRFTIQIMSLVSEQAENNLKRIISQPEYRAIDDKLVVLTPSSNPPSFLVFYGMYPNMTAARNGRNTMPVFLRDRHPYPVSVQGAVEKARILD